MFSDQQTVTVNAIGQVMARIMTSGTSSTYRKSDGTYELIISHQDVDSGNRIRSMAKVNRKAIVTNPLDQTNDYDTLTVYVVIDRPVFGFTQADVEQLVTGFKTWLDTTAVGRMYGKES